MTSDIHLSSSPTRDMLGESPAYLFKPIKQAFNLLLYAQKLVLPLISLDCSHDYDPTGFDQIRKKIMSAILVAETCWLSNGWWNSLLFCLCVFVGAGKKASTLGGNGRGRRLLAM